MCSLWAETQMSLLMCTTHATEWSAGSIVTVRRCALCGLRLRRLYWCVQLMRHVKKKENAFLLSHFNNGYKKAQQRYVTRTLPILLHFGLPPMPREILQNGNIFMGFMLHVLCHKHHGLTEKKACALNLKVPWRLLSAKLQRWSQWPRGLRRRSTAARLLRSWVRITPRAWMSVCCECFVLSGRGLCDEVITRPEASYLLWRVAVCDIETSWMRSQT
jgi:hypothetical protein